MSSRYYLLLLTFACLLVSFSAHAQFFNQDFNLVDNDLGDYTDDDPNIRQFDEAEDNGAVDVEIDEDAGALRFFRDGNGNGTAMIVRSTNIVGSPLGSFIIRFSITDLNSRAAGASGQRFATVQLGSGFGTNNNLEDDANVYVEFRLNVGNANNQFTLSHSGGTSATSFPENNRITVAGNNSGASITYIAPDGTTVETLGNDKMDLWVGTTKLFDDVEVKTPTQTITNFKIVVDAGPSLDFPNSSRFSVSLDDLSIFPLGNLAGSYTVGAATNEDGDDPEDNYQFTSLTRNGGGFFEMMNFRGGVAGAVNFNVHTNISIENGVNALNPLANTSATNVVRIRPNASTLRTISGDVGNAMIRLNGADFVVMDGRNPNSSGTGSNEPRYLRFRNTNTGNAASVFALQNDASNNLIAYAFVESNSTTANGLIFIGTGTNTGNDNNTITYCDIRNRTDSTPTGGTAGSPGSGTATGNLPRTAIRLAGSSALLSNSGNKIEYCNIFNFYQNSGSFSILDIASNNDGLILSNNSFYQTVNYIQQSGGGANYYEIISVGGTNNTDVQILNNSIGGRGPNLGTGQFTHSHVNINTGNRCRIRAIQSSGTNTTISGNRIAQISMTFARGSATDCGNEDSFRGIFINGGSHHVTNNVVGSTSATNSLQFFHQNSTGCVVPVIGYDINASLNSTMSGNTVAGILLTSTSSTLGFNFRGIAINNIGTNNIISNNTVGSSSVANSISTNNNNTLQLLRGISIETAVSFSLQNNTVSNISLLSPSNQASLSGIHVSAGGNYTIASNTISNLTSTSTAAGAQDAIAVAGFAATGTGNYVFRNNTLHTIQATSATNGAHAAGIFLHSGAAGIIDGNRVYNILTNTGTNSYAAGILVRNFSPNLRLQNNMVSLGITPLGASNASDLNLVGLYHNATDTDLLYAVYNTLHIGGDGASTGFNSSYSFYRGNNSTTPVFLHNNLLQNTRYIASGNGQLHVPIRTDVVTNWGGSFGDCAQGSNPYINYNAYFSENVGDIAFYNGAARSFGEWQAASGSDANGIDLDAVGLGGQVEFVNVATADLRLSDASEIRLNGKAYPLMSGIVTTPSGILPTVTNDVDNENRIGPDIGADERIFEFTANASGNWGDPAVWAPNGIPSFGDIVRIPSGRKVSIPTAEQRYFYQLEVAGELELQGNAAVYGVFDEIYGGKMTLDGLVTADTTATIGLAGGLVKNTASPINAKVLMNLDEIPSPFACYLNEYILPMNQQSNAVSVSGLANDPAKVFSLTVLNNGILTLNKDLTVGNAITDLGVLNIGTGELRLNGFRLTLEGDLADTPGQFFGSTTSQLIINGQGDLTGSLAFDNGTAQLGTLSINRPSRGKVNLVGGLAIANTLALTNGLLIATGEVSVTSPTLAAVAHSANGYVVGTFRRAVNAAGVGYDLPVGSLFNRNLATVTFTNLSGVTSLVTTFDPDFIGLMLSPTLLDGLVEYRAACGGGKWNIEGQGGAPASAVYNLVLETNGQICTGSAFTIAKLNGTAASFASSVTGTENSRSGFVGFSDFVGLSDITFLPVTMLSFTAQREGSAVRVAWETAQERGIGYYAVERSANGRDFAELGKLAAVNNDQGKRYEWLDRSWNSLITNGLLYYRLRYLDEGTVRYTPVVAVAVDGEGNNLLTAYPNPTSSSVKLEWQGERTLAQVSITDLSGRVFWQDQTLLSAAPTQLDALSGLASGIYLLQVRTATQVHTVRLVKE